MSNPASLQRADNYIQRSECQVRASVDFLMNNRFLLRKDLAPFSSHTPLTAVTATHLSSLPIDVWWRREGPGPENGGSGQKRVIHRQEEAPSLWAITVWGINVSEQEGVHPSCLPHSSTLQPRESRLPEPHLTPHHKYNYTVCQPALANAAPTTSSSGHQQDSAQVHRCP